MNPSLFLDENISPSLSQRFWDMRIEATHAQHRNLRQTKDDAIWRLACEHGWTVVTINYSDFIPLARSTPVHAGVIGIPSHGTRDQQFSYIMTAIEWGAQFNEAAAYPFMNRFVRVTQNMRIMVETCPVDH
ncbi:hypothetical protein FF100_33955 [Methylobacterium terricola]|uniref:DUF5615 domain-containing protein n=1 Tax=Methylobacterium terricola TaxID=2583531 RepID=A0A5C4L8T6_9HYPH|nr:DUF5615 family PIN-like protein [Methylobacterium terricola]TNC06821.1 hypothetical protein FF100_33955 [Methylobacterium terricola]